MWEQLSEDYSFFFLLYGNYELTPLGYEPPSVVAPSVVAPTQKATTFSKAEQLRELKSLLDEKIITSEEYEKEKAKILERDN